MPPKKQKKTKEEKTAEGFFPVDEDDLKNVTEKPIKESIPSTKSSIEIPVKPPKEEIKSSVEKKYSKPPRNELETVEKISTKKPRRKYSRKKTAKSKSDKGGTPRSAKKGGPQNLDYKPPKTKLKSSGYELIITEKPQAALKIASALGTSVKRNVKGVPYYEVSRDGKKIVVGCAVGHLFTLSQNSKRGPMPNFDIDWKPNYLVRKNDFTKKYFDVMLKLSKQAGSLTVATDFDIEGEVIGFNVVRLIAGQKDASRMKFSTLTNAELNKAYEQKNKTIEWGQAIAGETRHYLDWFYGINLSRALMNSISTTGKFKIMSIGRVQGPALELIVKKEREILAFKPEPYWQIFITVDDGKNKLELKHIKDIFKKTELKKLEKLKGKTAIAETKKSSQKLPPQPPFNLTTLQTEAYKFHGITPSNTLKAAQSLYLSGLISYPRTSSQKLPAEIGYKEILKKLSKEYKVEHLIKNQKPLEGKKSDPAHPSIYPTGNKQILSGDEEKIYNLIVKRFLSLFCEDATIDNKTVKATVDKLIFNTKGSEISKKSWLEIYPSKLKETQVPDMNGKVKIINSKTLQKETLPPKRFSPASIISQLEKKNLGTKATRSSILETLYDRGYVQGKSIEATPLGMSLITTLEKYSPIIIDEQLTRHFEQKMDSLIDASSNKLKGGHLLEKKEEIIDEAKKTITDIAKDFEKNEKKIGKELLQANLDYREQQKIENTLLQCPKCKKGNLAITYSKKNQRHFVACDAYPDCQNTFSLPPNGIIKKTDKVCEECGWPILIRLSKGKRPWEFCFNPDCKTNEKWVKKRNENLKNKK